MSDFWDHVKKCSAEVNGTAGACDDHPNYAAKEGAPTVLCPRCWELYGSYTRFKNLSPRRDDDQPRTRT